MIGYAHTMDYEIFLGIFCLVVLFLYVSFWECVEYSHCGFLFFLGYPRVNFLLCFFLSFRFIAYVCMMNHEVLSDNFVGFALFSPFKYFIYLFIFDW